MSAKKGKENEREQSVRQLQKLASLSLQKPNQPPWINVLAIQYIRSCYTSISNFVAKLQENMNS